MSNKIKLGSLALALAFTAAACGDDATDTAADEATETTVEAEAAEEVVEDEAMEDEAMEDEAMEEADHSEDEAMEDDAMEDEAMEELGTIVDVAADAGSFTTLLAAAEAADLVETLNGEGPFTVFAPTDEAFGLALEDLGLTAEELLADTETLSSILTYHVVSGTVLSTDLADGAVPTVNGADITVDLSDGVKINEANVVTPDVKADNGVIHVIDGVLLP